MTKKILMITVNAWTNENSIGNTFSNWFDGIDDMEIHNIFMREENPNNNVCDDYFRISDRMLIKNIFSPSKIGEKFNKKNYVNSNMKVVNNEKQVKKFLMSHRSGYLYVLQEILWSLNMWKNNNLKQYVKDVNPDIIFSFAMPGIQYFRMINYVKKYSDSKLVLYISDNVYSKFMNKKSILNPINDRRIRKLLKSADVLYGASQELCDVYSKEFNVKIKPLYKGAVFEDNKTKSINSPIRFTYAGNLQYGRLETLIDLAKSIDKINNDGNYMQLDIYSGTDIDSDIELKIKSFKGCMFHGKRSYSEIKQILSSCDIVLHVESFLQQQIDIVKYSFSTKIIDCLQSGNVLMAIGPKGISSIEYPRTIDGAIVIDNVDDIYNVLKSIMKDKNSLLERCNKIRLFAEQHHSISVVQNEIVQDFEDILKKR